MGLNGGEMAEIVRATYIPNLHLVPGQLELMEFEHETPKALMSHEEEGLFVLLTRRTGNWSSWGRL